MLLTENKTKEIVIIGPASDPSRQRLVNKLQQTFLPDCAIIVGEEPEDFLDVVPFATEYKRINGQTTVYICENFACKQPTTNIENVMEELNLVE